MSGVGTGEDNSDKGTYKGITGGLKYILMKTFLIYTGDDPENAELKRQRRRRRESPRTRLQSLRPRRRAISVVSFALSATRPSPT
jgi:hypothetical protein